MRERINPLPIRCSEQMLANWLADNWAQFAILQLLEIATEREGIPCLFVFVQHGFMVVVCTSLVFDLSN